MAPRAGGADCVSWSRRWPSSLRVPEGVRFSPGAQRILRTLVERRFDPRARVANQTELRRPAGPRGCAPPRRSATRARAARKQRGPPGDPSTTRARCRPSSTRFEGRTTAGASAGPTSSSPSSASTPGGAAAQGSGSPRRRGLLRQSPTSLKPHLDRPGDRTAPRASARRAPPSTGAGSLGALARDAPARLADDVARRPHGFCRRARVGGRRAAMLLGGALGGQRVAPGLRRLRARVRRKPAALSTSQGARGRAGGQRRVHPRRPRVGQRTASGATSSPTPTAPG